MSGWRDSDGRTASDRRKLADDAARSRFLERVRHRPLSLLRPIGGALFIALLVVTLLLAFR